MQSPVEFLVLVLPRTTEGISFVSKVRSKEFISEIWVYYFND